MTPKSGDPRQRDHDDLAERIRACRKCGADMNVYAKTQSSPGYGDIDSPVVVVGQSLCGPCMKVQQPFFGGSGKHLNEALARAGYRKEDIYTTNVVHCHPQNNVASKREWVANCAPFLLEELAILRPRVAIGFGDDAHDALRQIYGGSTELDWRQAGGGGFAPRRGEIPALVFPPHPGSFRWISTKDGTRAKVIEDWESSLARVFVWSFQDEPT